MATVTHAAKHLGTQVRTDITVCGRYLSDNSNINISVNESLVTCERCLKTMRENKARDARWAENARKARMLLFADYAQQALLQWQDRDDLPQEVQDSITSLLTYARGESK